MRIALISQPLDGRLPPPANSVAIWSFEVARHLAAHDAVTVFSSAGRRPQRFAREGITFRLLPTLADPLIRRVRARLLRKPRHPLYTSFWYAPGYALQVAALLAAGNYDVIHLHNFTQLLPVFRRFNRSARIVLHMHCEWLNQLDRDLLASRLRAADAVVFCSAYLAGKAQRRFPEYADRFHVVPNGVDASAFTPATPGADATPEDVLLFVGRVSPEKGVHVLLRAFNRVRREFPGVRLQIVGPCRPLPKEFIVALSDDPHVAALGDLYATSDYISHLRTIPDDASTEGVTFLGALPHAGIARAYASASVVINPSLTESFGMSLVEAMATGVPVVASRVGGIPEVVEEHHTGLLVAPDDHEQTADAIIRLLRDRALRFSMGARGRQRVLERFDWSRVTETLRHVYRTAAAPAHA